MTTYFSDVKYIEIEPLLEELNEIFLESEEELKKLNRVYNLQETGPHAVVPDQFKYHGTITRIRNDGTIAFQLKQPPGAISLSYKNIESDMYLDRVHLDPFDIQNILKDKDSSKKIINKLVNDMLENLKKHKQLDISKKYIGKTIATMVRPGTQSRIVTNYQDEFIEIRLYSDATEISQGEKNDSTTINSTESSTSGTTTNITD